MSDCSVIVCTRHRPEMLARCLTSLAALDGSDPEVIVIDNTSGDHQTEQVAREAGSRYLVETRTGLSRARNAGIAAARGELIAFLDDDAIADRAWLSRHSEVLADDSLIASTGRILPMVAQDGRGLLDLGEQAFDVDRSDPWWFERANFGGVAAGGSNMVVKRRAFDDGLRFRETLGSGVDLGGFEEHYLFFTLIKGGGRVAYVPGAVVRHSDAEVSYRYNAAYLTMLLVEEPDFRRRTLRYAIQAFRRQQIPSRHTPPASRLKMLATGYRGPLLYLRSRLASR